MDEEETETTETPVTALKKLQASAGETGEIEHTSTVARGLHQSVRDTVEGNIKPERVTC